MRLGGPHILPLAMFVGTFAWSFVYVSLPFHIQAITTVDPVATLRWTGWILGISPLATVVTAPLWGRYAERANPKTCYVLTQWLQGFSFFGMALARTLAELLVSRLILGVVGAASTFAFISAVFVTGVAAAIGALLTNRLAELFPERRLIMGLLLAASVFQVGLALPGSVWLYGIVRFLQVLCIAPVFPLVVARIAQHAGGGVIGFVNSARIGAAFVGPVVATTLLSWTSPLALYLVLGAIGVACLPLAAAAQSRARA